MKKHAKRTQFLRKTYPLMLLSSLGLAFVASAKDVPISSVISGGVGASYDEAEPNLWFVLDDSGSMREEIPYNRNETYIAPKGAPSAYTTSNYRIWYYYYSTKMNTLKSSLSVVLFNDEYRNLTDGIRIGYTAFKGRNHITPVLPLYGENAATNRQTTKQWINNLSPRGFTPLRGATMKVLKDTISAYKEKDENNPGIVLPGEEYHKEDNKILSCRRNYMLVMTDGQWNDQDEPFKRIFTAPVADALDFRTYNKLTLKDNKEYTGDLGPYPRAKTYKEVRQVWDPYAYQYVYKEVTVEMPKTPTISDLALYAWKTDLDGDDKNNDLKSKNTKINNQIVELPETQYPMFTKAEDRQYWHPWNDPASWQHFNVYTMGFFPQNDSEDIAINPPNDISDYLKPSFRWSVKSQWLYNPRYGYYGGYEATEVADSKRDLAAAAMAGRGRYYDVKTPTDMIDAFTNLLNDTLAGSEAATSSGGGGAAGGSQTLDNSYYATRYDGETFTGELIKYELYNGTTDAGELASCFGSSYDKDNLPQIGTPCKDPVWQVAPLLTARAKNGSNGDFTTDRHIISGRRKDAVKLSDAYEIKDFNFANLSQTQKNLLKANFPDELTDNFASNDERLTSLVEYVQGSKEYEATNTGGYFRNRDEHTFVDGSQSRNILGTIMRSAPKFVGIPTAYLDHLEEEDSIYKNYTTYLKNFIDNNTKGEKEVIYVGADDGMLHAFEADSGKEVFAYVPNAVYSQLPSTVTPNKQLSLVDGNIDVQSVHFSKKWYRALVAGMGGGAHGLFALNVTGQGSGTPTAKSVKDSTVINWEYSDTESKLFQKANKVDDPKSNVGNILAAPAIIQLQDDTWVAITGNGYNAESRKAAVLVVDLETGKPIQELVIDNKYTDSTKANGLGPLYFVSYPGKDKDKSNRYDRAYAGDLQGNLWVFDLVGSTKSKGIKLVSQGGSTTGTPLFTAKDGDKNPQAITVYPLAVQHPLGYGYLIHFGTGELFKREAYYPTAVNNIYAIWDDWIDDKSIGLPTGGRTTPVTKDQLNKIDMTKEEVTVTNDTGKEVKATVRYIDSDKTDATEWQLGTTGQRGWQINLMEGERAWQPAYIAYGANNAEAVAYNTTNYQTSTESNASEAATECYTPGTGVDSWQLAFNMKDASLPLPSSGVIDINGDNTVDSYDAKTKNSAGEFENTLGALQGLGTSGEILFNGTTQVITPPTLGDNNPVPNPVPNPDLNREDISCKFTMQTTGSSSGSVTPNTVERCSYFSSWTEMK